MKELEYPFDADDLMLRKRKLKRLLLENIKSPTEIKVAILGGSTTADIKDMLELFLLNNGIQPEFYECEYNQYYQEALFPSEKFLNFKPDIVYICTSNKNINNYPNLLDSKADVEIRLKKEFEKFKSIWSAVFEKHNCIIVQNNFDMPSYRLLGNKDVADFHGASNFIMQLNNEFSNYSQTQNNFYICDLNYISADFGLAKWHDESAWCMYKYAMSISAIPHLSFNVANIIKSLYGKNKKGFVFDLDNTLWGGVIGDDGVEKIALGQEDAQSEAYFNFQKYVKLQKQLGVVLNINSKNDYENALAGLNHPNSLLKKDDFVEIKANWENKDKNFVSIANSLSLLPESLVFVDDNPAERLIVTENLKNVCVPEINSITDAIRILDRNGFFETTNLSSDDVKRNDMYKQNTDRANLAETFSDYGEYLTALRMKSTIRPFEPVHLARIAQLTNKSNQFNLTTHRYSQTELEEISKNKSFITLYGKLEDKFGDNGIVSIVIGRIDGEACYIDLWLMSCRVLKRDMECAMMDSLVSECQKKQIKKIYGTYIPSGKNAMVQNFYLDRGFSKLSEDGSGKTEWVLDLNSEYKNQNKYIEILEV